VATRSTSGGSAPQASAYAPPPDRPTTPSRSAYERVGHLRHVGEPVGHRGVAVRIRQPSARPLHDDDAQTEVLGGTPPQHRELAPGAECAVKPQHHRTRRVTEFRVAKPATVRKGKRPSARGFSTRGTPGGCRSGLLSFIGSQSVCEHAATIGEPDHRLPTVLDLRFLVIIGALSRRQDMALRLQKHVVVRIRRR